MDGTDQDPSGAAATIDPERWVDEHGDALYRFALIRLRDPERAEDIVQETFAAALHARAHFAGRSTERTWLIGILKRKIIDQYRKRWREVPATELAAGAEEDLAVQSMFDERGHWLQQYGPNSWSNPSSAIQEEDFFRTLHGCMGALPGRLADAFTLREIDSIPSDEVCQILGITPTNLWAMLHRARVRLRMCMEKNWFGREGSKP
ncbi:sigma-70 family RNA polymerase sigma factor [bacterium]|nr:sigma-70 family RNA polymerase sigma factor [bacterium]